MEEDADYVFKGPINTTKLRQLSITDQYDIYSESTSEYVWLLNNGLLVRGYRNSPNPSIPTRKFLGVGRYHHSQRPEVK